MQLHVIFDHQLPLKKKSIFDHQLVFSLKHLEGKAFDATRQARHD